MSKKPASIHPAFNHLTYPLAPLLSITTSAPHPAFPATLLHFHLLTESQLDELAHYYHQRTPTALSFDYPMPVVDRWTTEQGEIERKRRLWGRFVGLKGCESPTVSTTQRFQVSREMWGQREWDRWVQDRIEAGMETERRKEEERRKWF